MIREIIIKNFHSVERGRLDWRGAVPDLWDITELV